MSTESSTLSYTRDIKSLFREGDRYAMLFAFDLWNYQDVCKNAQAILERLTDGTMPFDRMDWPEEHTTKFRHWMEAGMPA